MPATDFQGATSSFGTFGLSLLSMRRDQVHSMYSPAPGATSQDFELEAFQKHVAERLNDLLTADSSEFLSIPWIRKLLDVFLYCQDEFRVLIFNNKAYLNKPPMDRYVSEYFERSVKALDVCNAIRDGIENIRSWQKQVEIVLCALDGHKSFGEGHFRRAKKALTDLAIGMLDEKDGNVHAHRNRSFARQTIQRDQRSLGHFRSLSWSVSRSWSAARQLQAIGNNLVAPRANEVMATNGLAVTVFTMSYFLLFVMWALVAAIPCQDRGLGTHFSVTRQYIWAVPILSLHERILEESRKRNRRNTCGLLQEIHEIGKCARLLDELADSVKFPLTEEKEEEVRQRVQKLGVVYEAVKDGLDPLERQVREVFHRIVRSRTEGLDTMGGANSHN